MPSFAFVAAGANPSEAINQGISLDHPGLRNAVAAAFQAAQPHPDRSYQVFAVVSDACGTVVNVIEVERFASAMAEARALEARGKARRGFSGVEIAACTIEEAEARGG